MRVHRWLPIIALPLLASLAIGCGDDEPEEDPDNPKMSDTLRIIKGEHSDAPADVKLLVTTPAAGQVLPSDKDSVWVHATVENFGLKAPTTGEQSKGIAYSPDGQHVHIIIDDKPYMAMYNDSFSVGTLAPGAHTLRAFPSRSWHESVKQPGAFIARTFYVKSKKGDSAATIDSTQPLLTYSRPKGEYKGKDAAKILLDFYVSNATLGPTAHKVIATIDNTLSDTLTEWVPYYIEGLKPGEHTIKLQLIGPDGQPVPGAYNTTERKITVTQ